MPKLTTFTNPISGTRSSLFNVGNLLSMVLGVVVLLAVFNVGTNLFNRARRFVPGQAGNWLDSAPASAPAQRIIEPTLNILQ